MLIGTGLFVLMRGQGLDAVGLAASTSTVHPASEKGGTDKPPASMAQSISTFSRVVDDRDEAYQETQKENLKPYEGWQAGSDINVQRLAYGHSYRVNNKGSMTASWTFADLPSGDYEVFMTWPPGPQFKAVAYGGLRGSPGSSQPSHRHEYPPRRTPRAQKYDAADWAFLDSLRTDSGEIRVVLDTRISKGGGVACDAVWLRARHDSQ